MNAEGQARSIEEDHGRHRAVDVDLPEVRSV